MLAVDPDLYHLLPPVAAQLATVIGHAKTFVLLGRLGGTAFPVGLGKRQDYEERRQKLIDVIGFEDTQKIEAVFGAETIYIPRCDNLRKIMRGRAIRAESSRIGCTAKGMEGKEQAVLDKSTQNGLITTLVR